MSQQQSDQRRRVADAAVAAENLGCVFAVDVIPAGQDPTDRWVLDLLVEARGDGPGVPSEVHELFGEYELGTLQRGPRGADHYQGIAVA